MRKILALMAAVVLALPLAAQDDVDLDNEFGGRVSVELDKKLRKGLHVFLEEEVRLDNNFGAFDRFHTTLGLSYKVHPNVKVGVGYALINPYSSTNAAFKNARHRVMVDASANYKVGAWTFSLKERVQLTYRTGDMNEYQNLRAAFSLKSRLKAQYRVSASLTPYAYIELRNTLNAPVIAAYRDENGTYVTEDGYETGNAGWFISGWNGVYVNRLRGSVGVNYKFDKHNTLNLYILADRVMDKVVDANAEGTKLKSYTRETGFIGQVGVAYTYSL